MTEKLELNLLSSEMRENPYPTYARLRTEAPVFRHPMGFVAVSRHQDVQFVLRSPELFSSEAMGGAAPRSDRQGNPIPGAGSLISQDPPVHTEQRRIISRGFTPRMVARLEPSIQRLTDELVAAIEAKLEAKAEFDLIADLAVPLPVTVIAELLGLDPSRRHDFKRWADTMVIGSTGGGFRRSDQDRQNIVEFRDHILEQIEARRKAPGEDLISLLIHAEEEDGILSADQVFAFATLLLIAGAETTTNLIGNAVLAAEAHPEALAAVREQPERIRDFVEETLRYDPPVQLVNRMAKQDVELHGETITKGSFVMAMLGAANRDPERFAEPDRFDMERDSSAHLAFGFGNHYCLGASLARLEAITALTAVFTRLPAFAVDHGRLERQPSFLVRGPRTLPARFC
ncbi:MAG: cytochrome P450 [Myxococcales bacterium]|nr:cytochrome P450 [Myxococcales bacterium]